MLVGTQTAGECNLIRRYAFLLYLNKKFHGFLPKPNLAHFAINAFHETSALAWSFLLYLNKEFHGFLPKHNLAHFAINVFYETSALAWFLYRHFVKEFYVQSNIQAMRVAMAMPHPLTSRKKKLLLFRIAIFQFLPIKTGTRVFSTQGKTDKNIPDEIRTLCKQGRLKEALHALYTMNNPLDSATYASILQVCIKNKALSEGKLVHAHINVRGFMPDRYLSNTVVNMYAKCGSLVDASRVFNQISQRNVFSWTLLIAAYARHGFAEEALRLFQQMQETAIKPDEFTFASILPACAKLGNLEQGMEIHQEIIRCGFESDVFVGNALVDMYAKCRKIEKARLVFDKMRQRDIVSWTTIIAGYTQNGHVHEAADLFQKMPQRNIDSWNAMIAGYAQNGHVDEAVELFWDMPDRNIISWNAMIAGFMQNGHADEALEMFRKLLLEGMKPDSKTFSSVLSVCTCLEALQHGVGIHEEIIRNGLQSDVVVGSALINMYAKCGNLGHACKLFDKMPQRNAITWTGLIAGHVQNRLHVEALKLFQQMQLAGVKPDMKTFATVLTACASLAALEQGVEIHKEITRSGSQPDVFVISALIDMYAKCGSIDKAWDLFNKIPQKNIVCWTAMIAGYAMHGFSKEALQLFRQMQASGINPNHVTFVGVLSACCHSGLVDQGLQYFNCMSQYYHITPTMEHYGCMVDLLARAGRFDEAQDFIYKMPLKPDATVWGCLLGACRVHNNIELGECVAEHLFQLDPKDATPYVLLSNIYASMDRRDGMEKVQKMMTDRRVKKMPGCSWIEINKRVHTFLIGDRSHPEMRETYDKLEGLSQQIKNSGYVSDTVLMLNEVK